MTQRVALITGGSRGIGLATARRLARHGAGTVIAARNRSELETAAQQILEAAPQAAVEPVAVDVASADGVRRLVDHVMRRFGRLDVLVNNAGLAPMARASEMSEADFDALWAVNVRAVFLMCRAAWPVFQRQGGGVIVNVSSVASIDPFAGFAAYGASKAWVNLYTQALAAEGRQDRIRAYAVAPGAVETAMLRQHFPDFSREQTLAPDDVAAMIEACCEPAFQHSSGQVIFVRR